MRVEKLKATFEVETVLVHFPLHPETPLEGRSMAEVYAGRNIDPEAMYQRMKGLMDAEGLPYGRRTHSYNSRLAQELGPHGRRTFAVPLSLRARLLQDFPGILGGERGRGDDVDRHGVEVLLNQLELKHIVHFAGDLVQPDYPHAFLGQ